MKKEVIDEICRHFSDEGKLIEAGFACLRLTMLSNAPINQINDMRIAFFAGAQHLFASIMGILEPGTEPTANDFKRLTMIQTELEEFVEKLKASQVISH